MSKNKVIFLDIDGPMLSGRAWVGSEGEGSFRGWDQIACRMVKLLLDESGAKLVISSTWRTMGFKDFRVHLCMNGFYPAKHLHDDWQTGLISGNRSDEIHRWLSNHPEIETWISLDDAHVEGEGAITVSFDDGISFRDYNSARKMLGLKRIVIL